MATPARTHRFRDMTGATSEDYEAAKEEMGRWLDSPEGIAACEAAVRELREVRQMILDETGGRGISHDDLDEAIEFARER